MYSSLYDFIKNHLVKPNTNLFLKGRVRLGYLNKHYPDFLKEIYFQTAFLDEAQGTLIERLYCLINDIKEIPKCKCGNLCKYEKQARRYSYFCSSNCKYAVELLQANCKKYALDTYGVDHLWKSKEIREKSADTWEKKYGTRIIGKAKEVIDKRLKTNNLKFGGNAPGCRKDIAEKIKQTNKNKTKEERLEIQKRIKESFDKTNIDGKVFKKVKDSWNSKSKEDMYLITSKRRKTNLAKYSVDNPTQRHINKDTMDLRYNPIKYKEYLEDLHNNKGLNLKQIAEQLQIDPTIVGDDFKKYDIKVNQIYRSSYEDDLLNFIETLGIKAELNSKIPGTRSELDLYVPDKKFAIEFNGLFWHSFRTVPEDLDKFKHYKKTNLCRQQGIKLVHIFQHEMDSPNLKDIWKSKLQLTLVGCSHRVYARDLILEEVSIVDARNFLNKNHLQGFAQHTICYGLRNTAGDLISIMSFLKQKNTDWELNRFCTNLNTIVVGGASKLLKAFERNNSWKNIISFADLRYSYGDLYTSLGFEFIKEVPVSYYYTDCSSLYHKRGFQKQYLSKKLGELYDPNKTEVENVLGSGKYRILYDCGKLKFSKTNKV